tara:strand:- start:19031 stop:20878 length:1848 start_codon:yes stop_codon:yes gene_type:complete
MCGIVGYISKRKETSIETLLEPIFHRGPDSFGVYQSGDYHAGMNRLKINDLHSGDQPLYNEDKSIVLFYNGEIYNYKKLKNDLIKLGQTFRTKSDGEVICYLYELHGERVFELLDGMFAIALWDDKKKILLLARDIPGEKPLYYSELSKNEIVFASEIKSLQKFNSLDLNLNNQAIWDFPTFLWIPEPDTIFKNIHAVKPGNYICVSENGISYNKYKNQFYSKEISLDPVELIQETRRVVEEAVKSRLLSDVPVGAFLSGGLDSSIISSIASKEIENLSTFTIGFEDLSDPYHGSSDESVEAQLLANKLGTNHHLIKVGANEFRDSLMDFCKYGDQPFSVSSGLGILSVAKAAKEYGIKVLLSGDGADECFGGYSWYNYLQNKNKLIEKHDNNISFQNFGIPVKDRIELISSYSPKKKAWAWHYYASELEKSNLFSKDLMQDSKSSLRWFKNPHKRELWAPLDYISQDRAFYFPNEMLKKVDRMTMAHSIEGRAPFASPSVLAFSEKLGINSMINEGQLKWILRQAFSDILPKHVINRPKHGFNVPIDHWLKSEWKDLFHHTFSEESKLFKMNYINKDSMKYATNMLNNKLRLNGHTIFSIIMLNMWLENFYYGN